MAVTEISLEIHDSPESPNARPALFAYDSHRLVQTTRDVSWRSLAVQALPDADSGLRTRRSVDSISGWDYSLIHLQWDHLKHSSKYMRSLPDILLDLIEDSHRVPEGRDHDGEFWYNSGAEMDEEGAELSEPERLHLNIQKRSRDEFRRRFWSRTLLYGVVALSISAFVACISTRVSQNVAIEATGIWLTILGSMILGRSILRGPSSVADKVKTTIPTVDGENVVYEIRNYVESTIDGINGVLYLTLGFLLQMIGTLVI
ncbi:hypothetical protein ACKVMT_07015 [Halobacteriales archaeon Cl-PHB]